MSILSDTIDYIPSTSQEILEDDVYKQTLILSINNSLSTLVQNSVGHHIDLSENDNLDWDDFFGSDFKGNRAPAKMYVFLRAQLEFDPPQSNIQKMFEESADEALWRARMEGEFPYE